METSRIMDNKLMKRTDLYLIPVFVLLLLCLLWFLFDTEGEYMVIAKPAPLAVPVEAWRSVRALEPVKGLSRTRVALGARLFRDNRLSLDRSLACVSCHDLTRGGSDGRKFSFGVNGARGQINAPTVFNAAYNFAQFWDGRAQTLEEQVAGPIHNPLEMASSWQEVMARLSADPDVVAAFAASYSDGLTTANVADAIASFERSLVTLGSPFDRFLKGDEKALSRREQEGFKRFQTLGCISCHQGMLLGGNMYQRFGVLRDYFAGKHPSRADMGRYNVTGRESDRHVFKVPSLRNIALTAPYFHDASATSLEEAVAVMGSYQLGRELSEQDIVSIVAFLKTLTGEAVQ